ncbi:MAG TPA: response regulator transcription factor [Acidimicrobiales bacterium]|nr:response regulator transcription factor [Acidimicrobiales bacterium]
MLSTDQDTVEPAPAVPGPLRLLLVEDEPDIRRLLRIYLERVPGLRIIGEAADGAEALRAATALEPNVVVLDLTMPVMDGTAVLPRIRSRLPDAAIVVFSAYLSLLAERSLAELGADAIISKAQPLSVLKTAILAAWALRDG